MGSEKPFRIAYHVGDELSLRTKAASGTLTMDGDGFRVSGPSGFVVAFADVRRVELFRMHGLGRMIRVVCKDGTIMLTVVRLNLLGYLLIINFFRTGELYATLKLKVEAGHQR